MHTIFLQFIVESPEGRAVFHDLRTNVRNLLACVLPRIVFALLTENARCVLPPPASVGMSEIVPGAAPWD